MQQYETLFVYHPNLGEAQVRDSNDRVRRLMEGMGAEITGLDEWGTRELAYPIQKQTRGFYVLLQYRGQPGVVKELERNLRISDDVLRYVSVRLPLNRKSPHERTAPVSTESSVEVSPAQEE